MNITFEAAKLNFFRSPLFTVSHASKEQLKVYAQVLWPIQVGIVVGLPILCSSLCKEIGALALSGQQEEELRLKQIMRLMLPPMVDEMGMGRDKFGLMHHDLFAKQVEVCTGLNPNDLRKSWFLGSANLRLAQEIRTAMGSVKEGLHMMYVVEQLGAEFFTHQEALFKNMGKPTVHSTIHKLTELTHAQEADDFMKFVEMNLELVNRYFGLWRDLCDEIYEQITKANSLEDNSGNVSIA